MAKYKITHHRDECIGCGACEAVSPKSWQMKSDNKVMLKGSKKGSGEIYALEADNLDKNMEAAESCPVNCIHIEENGKKKI
jgi:ferredoxin